MLKHEWTLKTLCWVNKARHNRTSIVEFHLHEIPKREIFIETKSRLHYQGWKEEEMGINGLMGTEFLLGVMKKFWRWMVEMVAQHYERT